MNQWSRQEAIAYYKLQDVSQNQQALIELLREIQKNNNGVISYDDLKAVEEAFLLKESFLMAVIKRYPSLRMEDVPHLLEICGGKNCACGNSKKLINFITSTYKLSSGEMTSTGGFKFRVVNCLKQCAKGPNIKWDGIVYNNVNIDKLKKIINK